MSKVTQIYPRLGGRTAAQGLVSDQLSAFSVALTTEQAIRQANDLMRLATERPGMMITQTFWRERNDVAITTRKRTDAEIWSRERVDPPLDPREGMNELPGR